MNDRFLLSGAWERRAAILNGRLASWAGSKTFIGWKNKEIPADSWNEPEAELLVGDVARKHANLFEPFKADVDIEDVISEALIACRAAWPKYNPKYQPSTYVCTVAYYFLISKARKLERKAKHETDSIYDAEGQVNHATIEADPDEMLDFAERIYQQSQKVVGERFVDPFGTVRTSGPVNRGHFKRKYTLAQALALLALQQRMKLSQRAMRHHLIEHPELCQLLGLAAVPPSNIFTRFYASATRLRYPLTRPPEPSAA